MVRRNHAIGDDIREKWCQKTPWFSRDRCVTKPWKTIFNRESPFLTVKDFNHNLPHKTLKRSWKYIASLWAEFFLVEAIASWTILILICWSHLVGSRCWGYFFSGGCLGENGISRSSQGGPWKSGCQSSPGSGPWCCWSRAFTQWSSRPLCQAAHVAGCFLETTLVTSDFNQKNAKDIEKVQVTCYKYSFRWCLGVEDWFQIL